MCSLGSLGKSGGVLQPFFANHVSEIKRIREQLRDLACDLPPVHHIPGVSNPADLGICGHALLWDLCGGSLWQLEPAFLRQPYEEWPTTNPEDLAVATTPLEEMSMPIHVTSLAMYQAMSPTLMEIMGDAVTDQSTLGLHHSNLVRCTLSREKLELSSRSLTWVLAAVILTDWTLCSQAPSPRLVEVAVILMIKVSSKSAQEALKLGKLRSLGATARGGVVLISGRVQGEKLAKLLGTAELLILMGSEELSKLILRKAHRQDHRRNPRDITAQSRRLTWIIGAVCHSKTTADKCYECRLRDKNNAKQLMGPLPDEHTSMLSPFEAMALDLFGPFQVKDIAKERQSFKCWVVAYICMSSKAVSFLPCPGYSMSVFLMTHRHFTGIFGQLKILYTDHALSLICAAESYDWGEIATVVSVCGTKWRLTAKRCSWRNRLAWGPPWFSPVWSSAVHCCLNCQLSSPVWRGICHNITKGRPARPSQQVMQETRDWLRDSHGDGGWWAAGGHRGEPRSNHTWV